MLKAQYIRLNNDKTEESKNNNKNNNNSNNNNNNSNKEQQYYCEDIANNESIGNYPLLSEPYENECVYVKQSTIKDGNQGLFAKINLKKNQVISFYNGIRIEHEDVNAREWEQNHNVLSIDEFVSVDGILFFFVFNFFFFFCKKKHVFTYIHTHTCV